jgi:hypothetical protein
MTVRLRKSIEAWLNRRGIDHPQAQWMVEFQVAAAVAAWIGIVLCGWVQSGMGFGVGALLATMNFCVLARIVPQLIQEQKGSILAVLASFYLRLLLTAVVLFLALVPAGLPPISVLAGLSTILVTFMVWAGKYIVTQQHKEA